jgi:uncharacterized protein
MQQHLSDFHSILWRRLDCPGHEAAHLFTKNSSWHVEGTAVFAYQNEPCRLDYRIVCSSDWKTRSAEISGVVGRNEHNIRLSVDAEQQWRLNDEDSPQVNGCLDLDLNFSPVTNLLPIRRLNLKEGEEGKVRAAWLRFPSFKLEPLDQIYRRIDRTIYQYESAGGRFKTDLTVNTAGFVTQYPGFWAIETFIGP